MTSFFRYLEDLNRKYDFGLLILLLFCLILKFGYHEVMSDHFVLDLKGMHFANSDILKNDWFTEKVPQPHWVYDILINFSYKSQLLPVFKFTFWISGVLLVWLGFINFFNALSTSNVFRYLGVLFLVLGPTTPVLSTTTLLGWALPHSLGAAALFYGSSLLLEPTRNRKKILFLLGLTPFIHAQQGLHFGLIVGLTAILSLNLKKDRQGLIYLIGSLLAMSLSLAIANKGGVVSSDIDYLCSHHIPFHCFSKVQPLRLFFPLLFFTIGLLSLFTELKKNTQSYIFSLVTPLIFIGFLIGFGFEYFDIQPVAALMRQANIYRWVSYFSPLACIGVAIVLEGYEKQKTSRLKASSMLGLMLAIWYFWIASYTGSGQSIFNISFYIFLFITLLLLYNPLRQTPKIKRLRDFAIFFFLTFILFLGNEPWRLQEPHLPLGQWIRQNVPVAETYIIAPDNITLRLFGERAIIADIKGIPFSNPYLREWEQRIQDLGGGTADGFHNLTFDDVNNLSNKYDANYLVLDERDPKVNSLNKDWKLISELPKWNYKLYKRE